MKHPYRSVIEIIKEIKKIPVLKLSDHEKSDETDKGVMKQIKKVVKKFRENEKYK